VHLGIVLLSITVITRETLLGVRNIETTIGGTLQGTEDTATSGGSLASDIQKASERALVFVDLINEVLLLLVFSGDNLSIDLSVTLVNIIESKLLKKTTSTKKTGAVSSGVVLQANSQSVSWQLSGSGLSKDTITIDQGVCNLADNLTVGETNDKAVFWGLVLVLVLGTKTLTLTVVGLSLATTAKFDLVTAEVSPVLLNLDESGSCDSFLALELERCW